MQVMLKRFIPKYQSMNPFRQNGPRVQIQFCIWVVRAPKCLMWLSLLPASARFISKTDPVSVSLRGNVEVGPVLMVNVGKFALMGVGNPGSGPRPFVASCEFCCLYFWYIFGPI